MRMRRLSGLEEHLNQRRTSDIRLSEGTSSNEAAMLPPAYNTCSNGLFMALVTLGTPNYACTKMTL